MTTHGQSKTKQYGVYKAMLARCYDENTIGYPNYGGRGITVCERWRNSYEAFFEDMGPRPLGGTLERKDTNGNYCKENCVWATQKEQCNNTRRNRHLTHEGVTLTVSQWADRLGIRASVLYCRLNNYNWPVARALTEPVRKVNRSSKESPDGGNVSSDGRSAAAGRHDGNDGEDDAR